MKAKNIRQNIYAETTFVCPSYWLAEAYTNRGREAWKYQYSVPAAIHGTDMTGYFGPATSNQGPDFVKAFMSMFLLQPSYFSLSNILDSRYLGQLRNER
jgi:carboxylesterase type B